MDLSWLKVQRGQVSLRIPWLYLIGVYRVRIENRRMQRHKEEWAKRGAEDNFILMRLRVMMQINTCSWARRTGRCSYSGRSGFFSPFALTEDWYWGLSKSILNHSTLAERAVSVTVLEFSFLKKSVSSHIHSVSSHSKTLKNTPGFQSALKTQKHF